MLNGLRRVRPDEPFSVTADGWNTIVDAVNDWAQGRKDQPAPQGRMIGCVEALALNSTGAALREYKPARVTAAGGYHLGNDEPAAVWNRRPLLTLGAPAAITDWVCVTLEAIPAGAIGRVAISGVCLCDVDSASGATWAAPQAGSTAALLGGSTGTVRVLHVPSSGGSQRRCAVYLHEQPAASSTSPVWSRTRLTTATSLSGSNSVVGANTLLLQLTIPSDGVYMLQATVSAILRHTVAGAFNTMLIERTRSFSTVVLTQAIPFNCSHTSDGNIDSAHGSWTGSLLASDVVILRGGWYANSGTPSVATAVGEISSDPLLPAFVNSTFETSLSYQLLR